MQGRAVEEYRAPLVLAWQLTNRCGARCLACCEESGPDRQWPDELTKSEALDLAHRIVESGIPYVAFGGGEPLGVPHCWEIFEILAAGGIALKLETDGRHIDDAAADRLTALAFQCVQVSVDGATVRTHERARPGSDFTAATNSLRRLAARGMAPQLVFVPSKLNIHEAVAVYELAVELGCSTFVSGPLMRLGRAALNWERLACSEAEWEVAVEMLRERERSLGTATTLSIYPWDILHELVQRLESPQAMLLVVPNGKVKLLNALPFAPADLRHESLEQAWQAYRSAWRLPIVREFIDRCRADPALLAHANETWRLDTRA